MRVKIYGKDVITSEHSIKDENYIWVNEKGEIFTILRWNKLRQYDEVKIVYLQVQDFE